MQPMTFSPRSPRDPAADKISNSLQKLSRYLFIVCVALLPLLFIPVAAAPTGHTKILFLLFATLVAVVLFALATLRTGQLRLQLPLPIASLWGVVIAVALSGLFSGSQYNSFFGHDLNSQTVAFLLFFATVVTVAQFLLSEKKEIMYLYLLLFASGTIIALYQLARLIMGPEFLSFGLELSATFSPLGAWNDLAVFYGLLLLLSLVALEQLPLPRIGKYIFAAVSLVALVILSVVQFTAIWILVGLGSLVVVMYSLMRHRLEVDYRESSVFSVIIAAITVILAIVFVVGGDQLSARISNATALNYLEVKPSVTATTEIAREVYSDNVLLGAGPNRFADVWRQYRDRSINETIFWNTDFTTGSGYIPTLFITTGLLGTLFILLFLGLFFWHQTRALMAPKQQDHFWYFIANSATIASGFLWIVLFIYTPGPAMILLVAIFTGVALVAGSVLRQTPIFWFDSHLDTRKTVVLIMGVVVVLLVSIIALYGAQGHYSAHYTYNTALLEQDVEIRHNLLRQASERGQSDIFPRTLAQSTLRELNAILVRTEPTAQDSDRFVTYFQTAVGAATEALNRDRQKAINWATLAAVYGTAASPETPEAGQQARNHLERALTLDPNNPELRVLLGEISVREGDIQTAREHFEEALTYKSNYIAALNVLTELNIAIGDISEARDRVRRIMQLQPNNPGRHYQLAILYLAEEMTDNAIRNLQDAIALDQDFANARYILALQYLERNQINSAIAQLRVVAELNPDNEEVAELLARLEAGESVTIPDQPIPEPTEGVTIPGESDGPTDSITPSETDLLQPVNTPPAQEERPSPMEQSMGGLDNEDQLDDGTDTDSIPLDLDEDGA